MMDLDRGDPERELLVLRCQRGERPAFEELIRAWERRLYFYVRRLVSSDDDAWQVLQEVWIQVVRSVHSLHDPTRLPLWLYSVARNNAISHVRRTRARKRKPPDPGPSAPTSPDVASRLELVDFVHDGLARLSAPDREILTLFYLRDLSVGEAAELLGIPPGTVKSRLHKAKKVLRTILEQEGAHDERPSG